MNRLLINIHIIFSLIAGFIIMPLSLSYAETYTYDDAGRLTNVTYNNGYSIDYTYDAMGNVLSLIQSGNNGDIDGDGLTNAEEMNIYGTNPLIADTDGDGIADGWEVLYNLKPLDSMDSALDSDRDGFNNLQEYLKGTNPIDPLSHPPVANAGRDQNVLTGLQVTIDGSASTGQDGGLITFGWTQTYKPADSTATLSDTTVPIPSFIADKDGHYGYDLTVCDIINSSNCSGPDSVTVYASLPNVGPNADAGNDQNVTTGAKVFLNGKGSNDPYKGPQQLTYLWNFAGLPGGSGFGVNSIVKRNMPFASFTPDVDGVFTVRLTVSDGEHSSSDDVLIMSSNSSDIPPNSNAGKDVYYYIVNGTPVRGSEVILNGSRSNDPDNMPGPLTYLWSFISLPAGSNVTNSSISGADTATPSFIPDVEGTYVVRLMVNDGKMSDEDNVSVDVRKLLCGAKAVTIAGTDGNDNITGTAGNDVIHGLDGDDVIDGIGGDDVVCGGRGNDTLTGGDGDDMLSGGIGNDILIGGIGKDILLGGSGDDSIDGGDGINTVSYGWSDTGVIVNLGSTPAVSTGQGNDTLYNIRRIMGSIYDDTLTGNAQPNYLNGGEGNDTINGLGAGDILIGGNGNDTINGGSGKDKIDGGTGTDTCSGDTPTTGDSAVNCETVIGAP